MAFPTYQTRQDLEALLANGAVEGTSLEFKDSRSLVRDEGKITDLCINVSALANSVGGQIIFGINENKKTNGPIVVDDGVVDRAITRDWISQILNDRVKPRLPEYTIDPIDLHQGQLGFVISVPQSVIGPHQAPDNRYYRRIGVEVRAMEDYEIKDVMRRSATPHLEVLATFWGTGSPTEALMQRSSEEGRSEPIRIEFIVSNKAHQPAEYAVMVVRLDINLKFTGPEYFEVGSVDIIDDHAYQTFARNLGFPGHPPLFKEFPESAGWLEIIVNEPKNRIHRFAIIVDILTPGYSKRTRWFIQQFDARLSLFEDTTYSPHG